MKLFWKTLLAILFAVPMFAQQPVVHNQTNASQCRAAASCSVTVSAKKGDTIAVGSHWSGTPTLVSITDQFGNNYASPLGPPMAWTGYGGFVQASYAKNINAGDALGPVTITVKLSAPAGGARISFEVYATSYSGLDPDPFDSGKMKLGLSSPVTPMTTDPISISTDGGVLWCHGESQTSVLSQGTGFTRRSSFDSNIVQDMIGIAKGSTPCKANNSPVAWTMSGLAFKKSQVDTVSPTVTITAPASNDVVKGVVTLTASATDNVGVTSLKFQLDGLDVGIPFPSPPYSMTIGTTDLPNGQHILGALVQDAAGNVGTASILVDVENLRVDLNAQLNWDDGTPIVGSVSIATLKADGTLNPGSNVQINSDGSVFVNLIVNPSATYEIDIFDSTGKFLNGAKLMIPLLLTDVTKFSGGKAVVILKKTDNSIKSVQFVTNFTF